MLEQKATPRSINKRTNYSIKFTKNGIFFFFNTPELMWFTNDGISNLMSFYPNQKKFFITEKKNQLR
jgi:hypothetical protein